jgi:hypothetical protein
MAKDKNYVDSDRNDIETLVDSVDCDGITKQMIEEDLEKMLDGDYGETHVVDTVHQESDELTESAVADDDYVDDNDADCVIADDVVLNKYEVVFINALNSQKKSATVDAVDERQARYIIAGKRHNVILSVNCIS